MQDTRLYRALPESREQARFQGWRQAQSGPYRCFLDSVSSPNRQETMMDSTLEEQKEVQKQAKTEGNQKGFHRNQSKGKLEECQTSQSRQVRSGQAGQIRASIPK